MAYPFEIIQDEFFYGLMWPKSITCSLISFLLTQNEMGYWVWDSNNVPTIMEAREFLNATFHTDYTNIEVLGRVKKLRSHYGLFNTMISQSGVHWNREINYVYATQQQWADWREMYPLSRAYTTQGEPLWTELKTFFTPDDGSNDGADSDDELIIIVDSDDEDMSPVPYQIVHALPALDQADLQLPVLPNSPAPEVIEISSDESNHSYHDYFDSDIDLGFSDDENQINPVLVDETIGEILNPEILYSSDSSDFDVGSPTSTIPIPSASFFAIRAAMHSIPYFPLCEGFTSSDDDSE
ncbi:hypothetical protein ACS0TY_029762 [Phlomoides rotata]